MKSVKNNISEMDLLKAYLDEVQELRKCSLLRDGKIPSQKISISSDLDYRGPENTEFAEFAMIMRKLISPREKIFFGNIANIAKKRYETDYPDICEHINSWQEYYNQALKKPVFLITIGTPPDLRHLLDVNPHLKETYLGEIQEQSETAKHQSIGRSKCLDIYMNGLLFHADIEKRKLYNYLKQGGLIPIVLLNARDTLISYIKPILQVELAIKEILSRESELIAEAGPKTRPES